MAEALSSQDYVSIEPEEDDDWEDLEEESDTLSHHQSEAVENTPPAPYLPTSDPVVPPLPVTDDDRYQCDPPATSALPMPADVHPNGAVYLVYLMVVWLHSRFKVPFRACNVILTICAVIFSLSAIDLSPPMFATLDTVLVAMAVEPIFYILPVCPQCKFPHPASTTSGTVCLRCGGPLFDTTPTISQQRPGDTIRAKATPLLSFPYKRLEHQLIDFIPEIEDQLDSWRLKNRVDGVYSDQFDGRICQELPGHDGRPFFRPDLKKMPDGKLRVGITLGVDW